jgi:hypothetical protein
MESKSIKVINQCIFLPVSLRLAHSVSARLDGDRLPFFFAAADVSITGSLFIIVMVVARVLLCGHP